jgi:hypothetical protein
MHELFHVSNMVISPNVLDMMASDAVFFQFVVDSLDHHAHGDWGLHDKYFNGTNNIQARSQNIMSAYEYIQSSAPQGVGIE